MAKTKRTVRTDYAGLPEPAQDFVRILRKARTEDTLDVMVDRMEREAGALPPGKRGARLDSINLAWVCRADEIKHGQFVDRKGF